MNFPHFNRRLHLYLGLSLLPWFLMYGASSLVFSHSKFFGRFYDDGRPLWTLRFDRPYTIDVPATGDLRPFGARILRDAGLDGSFGTYREGPDKLNVYLYTFRKSTRLVYYTSQHRLTAEDRRFRWDQLLTGMHARGGFAQEGVLVKLWSVGVDLASVGILLWIASGLYMWWKFPTVRHWGWVAIASGATLFALLLLRL
jgi:hypothetical protein